MHLKKKLQASHGSCHVRKLGRCWKTPACLTDSDLMDVNVGTRKKGWVFGGELGTESFGFLGGYKYYSILIRCVDSSMCNCTFRLQYIAYPRNHSQMMSKGVQSTPKSIVFRFHYHSQNFSESLGIYIIYNIVLCIL